MLAIPTASGNATRIPWFKMPIYLRCLPFEDRVDALAKHEAVFGVYSWRDDLNKEWPTYYRSRMNNG